MENQPVVISARHQCSHEDCGKSFIRKEHLTRHALSHTDAPSYFCNLCNRAFTRNDVLQKHVKGHTAKQESSERNKRACQPCHRAKTRCAGGVPCQSCLKRRILCNFDSHSNSTIHDQRRGSWEQGTAKSDYDRGFGSASIEGSQYRYGSQQVGISFPSQERNLSIDSATSMIRGLASPMGINSQIITAANDAPVIQASFSFDPSWHISTPQPNSGYMNRVHTNPHSEEAAEACEVYFDKFHPRWPIIHISSYDENTAPSHLNFSIIMIGKYLQGTQESGLQASSIHDRLMGDLFSKLTVAWRPKSDEDFRAWAIFQSALLNIIFAFYTGENPFISRATTMLSALVGVLREIGLFRPETAMPPLRADVFKPYAMVLMEQRKRLAMSLFKIDTYIAMFRSQPPLLRPEEMHFPLPTTFTVWNSRVVDYFDDFLLREPPGRQAVRISELMCSPFSGTPGVHSANGMPATDMPLFPEDIQIGLCALQASIWESVEQAPDHSSNPSSSSLRALLVQQVDFWKQKLDAFVLYDAEDAYTPQAMSPSTTISMPSSVPVPAAGVSSSYYHGLESHAIPGWQLVVLARPRSLVFDTTMLYHLLRMHIATDVRNLCQLANLHITDLAQLQHRRLAAANWACSEAGVEALRHAGAVLTLCRESGREFCGAAAEPLVLMAIYVGALVVWAWSAFSGSRCDGSCQLAGGVQSGIYMDGLGLCACSTEEIIARFRTYVPGGERGWAAHLRKFQAR